VNDKLIILELTGPLERAVGVTEVPLTCAEAETLGRILARLVEKHPAASRFVGEVDGLTSAAGGMPRGLLVVRDSVTLPPSLETAVAAGERLTLMPMLSGG